MPLYDMKCLKCNKEQEVFCKVADMETQMCSCGGLLVTLITCVKSQDWFKPHWNPNFDTNAVWVETKGKYKELCKKYNVTSRAL